MSVGKMEGFSFVAQYTERGETCSTVMGLLLQSHEAKTKTLHVALREAEGVGAPLDDKCLEATCRL